MWYVCRAIPDKLLPRQGGVIEKLICIYYYSPVVKLVGEFDPTYVNKLEYRQPVREMNGQILIFGIDVCVDKAGLMVSTFIDDMRVKIQSLQKFRLTALRSSACKISKILLLLYFFPHQPPRARC